MKWYGIGDILEPLDRAPAASGAAVVLLDSEELAHEPALPGLEGVLCHTPSARDARASRLSLPPMRITSGKPMKFKAFPCLSPVDFSAGAWYTGLEL